MGRLLAEMVEGAGLWEGGREDDLAREAVYDRSSYQQEMVLILPSALCQSYSQSEVRWGHWTGSRTSVWGHGLRTRLNTEMDIESGADIIRLKLTNGSIGAREGGGGGIGLYLGSLIH